MNVVEIRMTCPTGSCRAPLRVAADSPGTRVVTCPRCQSGVELNLDDALVARRRVERCPRCGGREFFIRKDFPQRLGLLIVVVAAVMSCIFLYFRELIWTWAVLGGAVMLDAGLYFAMRTLTACYRCRAEFAGAAYNPDHAAFDLATSEKYG